MILSLLSGAFRVLHLPCVDTDRTDAQIAQIVQLLELRGCFCVRLTNQEKRGKHSLYTFKAISLKFVADILAATVLFTQSVIIKD